jgi:hypothetical protein
MKQGPDPSDVAREALDRTAHEVRPGLRADVERAVADAWSGTPVADVRLDRRVERRDDRRARLLAVAAAAVLVVGVGVWAVRRDGGSAVVSTPTVPDSTLTTPVTTSGVPASGVATTDATTTDPPVTMTDTATTVWSPPTSVDRICTTMWFPPSLADGSPVGEVTTEGEYVGPGSTSVQQFTEGELDPTLFAAGVVLEGRTAVASVLPVGDPPLGGITITVLRDDLVEDGEPCALIYSVGPGLLAEEVRDLVEDWIAFWDDGTPVPGPTFTGITLPTDVVARRYVDEAPFVAVDRLGPDGRLVGQVDQPSVVAAFEGPQLDDTRRIALRGEAGGGRCANRELVVTGADGDRPVHPDLPDAQSVVVTPDGVVVATRDVCPPGTRWGDPGTRWEMVSHTPGITEGPPVVLLASREPDLSVDTVLFQSGDVTYALGDVDVVTIDDAARFVGVREVYSSEQWRYHVWSLSDPGRPLVLPSGCPSTVADPYVVAQPRFIGDTVVLVRWCLDDHLTDSGGVVVDVVDLAGSAPRLITSTELPALLPSYTNALDASVFDGDDGLWVLVNKNDVEQPTTTWVVHDGDVVDVSRRGYAGFAFRLDDLFR